MTVNSKFEIINENILQLNISGIEEVLDMPIESGVQNELTLTNADYVGQNELCRVVSPKVSETPKQDIEVYKTGDYKESNYIEIVNESHGDNYHELFCVTEKDSDLIDIDDLY